MNNYSVYYQNGELRVINRNKGREITKNEIYVLFHDLDHNPTKVFSTGEKLILRCGRLALSVTLENPREFFKSKYHHLLTNTINNVVKNIERTQVEKNKQKKIKTQKALKITTAVAPVVLIVALAASKTSGKEIDNTIVKEPIPVEDNITYAEPISDAQIMEVVNNNPNINETISMDTQTINENLVASAKSNQSYDSGTRVDYKSKNYNITMEVDDMSDTIETEKVKDYYDTIKSSGNRWGISPNWLSGLMTTESRGKETNLMQIIHTAFDGQVMKVYNFEEDEWKKVVFTNNPDKFKDVDITISEDELNNPKTNISAAAIILNHYVHTLGTDNISLITEAYNKGMGNVNINLNAYCAESGLSYEDIFNDAENTDFLKYSYVCEQGGPHYVSDVFKFTPNAEDGVYFYRMNEDQKEKVTLKVNRVLEQEVAKAR